MKGNLTGKNLKIKNSIHAYSALYRRGGESKVCISNGYAEKNPISSSAWFYFITNEDASDFFFAITKADAFKDCEIEELA
jgi:hypothetical protein